VKGFWEELEREGVYVDVLVLNSAITTAAASMFDIGVQAVWQVFEANVKGPLHFAELFYKQPGKDHAAQKVGTSHSPRTFPANAEEM
jgi:NAD(P)-dependent dehydrogenase (short-subunit alcohol dehydrogenase family)